MKKFRKLIPALCMLVVSAVLMSATTYAWFSMNTDVNVTGLEIEATAETYLLVDDTAKTDAAAIQAAAKTEADKNTSYAFTIAEANKKVKPVAVEKTATTNTELAKEANWYTMAALDAAKKDGDDTTKKSVADRRAADNTLEFADFVQTGAVMVTLAKGSPDQTQGIYATVTLTATTTNKDITGVTVIIADSSNTKMATFDSTTTAKQQVSTTNLTDTTVETLNIYVYYNGEADAVYTNNFAELSGATVSITFSTEA